MSITLTQCNPNGNLTGSYLYGRAISNDGQTITLTEPASPYYYETGDGGATWAGKTGYPAPAGYPNYAYIAASATGQVKIAVTNYGKAYVSTDGGQNWTTCAPGGSTISRYFSSCAVSANGAVMLICVQNGRAYRSVNSGGTWTEVQPAGAANKYWNTAGISDDGQVMVLGIGDALAGRAYISTNGGGSWSILDPNGYGDNLKWTSAALSADGSKIVLTATTGNSCYLSSNKGLTWRNAWPPTGSYDGINRAFYSSAISADGQKIIVGGMISASVMPFLYASEDGGQTWTDITPAGCGAYQTFVALHINRSGTAGYAAQTAGGRCWVITYRAIEDIVVDAPPFKAETGIELRDGIVVQSAVDAPPMQSESGLTANPFSGWEETAEPMLNRASLETQGEGYCALNAVMRSTAALIASVMVSQAEVHATAMMAESWLGANAFMGKWVNAPAMRSETKLDFIVAPGWQEMRPAGAFNMPIVGYYPSANGQVVLATAVSDWYHLYRTLDGGQTWYTVPCVEIENLGVGPCAISGDGKTMVVTGVNETSPVLAVSRDYGSTWDTIGIYQDWSYASIAINYDGSVILVCGSYNSSHKSKGYISRDQGRTWQRVYPMGHINTINGTTELNECWHWAVSGNGQVVLASSKELYELENGIYTKQPDMTWYRSLDSGVTWERLPVLYDSACPVTEMRLNYDGSVGLLGLNNRWVSAPTPYRWARLFDMTSSEDWDTDEISPGFPQDINRPWYCATSMELQEYTWREKVLVGEMWGGRLWYSSDGGNSYQETTPAGPTNLDWKQVWWFPTGRMIADCWNPYLLPQRRILYMTDDGVNWLPEVTAQSGYFGWGGCAMSADGQRMLAGRNGGRVYRSADGGVTWMEIGVASSIERQWAALAMDAEGERMLVGSNHEFEGPRVFLSKNGGTSWSEITLQNKALAQFPAVSISRDGKRMLIAYASVYEPGHVLYSGDGGTTWEEVFPKGYGVLAAWGIVAAFNDGMLLIGVGEWLYRSVDYGQTWERIAIPGNTLSAEIVGMCGNENGEILYAGTFDGRLWKSGNGANDWVEVRPKGDVNGRWYGLACNAAAGYLLVADNGGRVYRSKDSGATWYDQRVQGNRGSNWSGVAIDETGEIMAACTDDNLFYAYNIVRPGGPIYIIDDVEGAPSESRMEAAGALMGFFPTVAPLMSQTMATAEAWVWTPNVPRYRYRCYLSKDGLADIEVLCSGIQCTLSVEGRNFLSVTMPCYTGIGEILMQYQDGGQVSAFLEAENPDGAVIRMRMAQALIDYIRIDEGPGNRSASVSGYWEVSAVEEERRVQAIYRMLTGSGKQQWRLAGIPFGIRAGNVLSDGDGRILRADRVTIYISISGTQIDVTGT